LFKERNLDNNDVKDVANTLKSMILKMDESLSPAHSNEIKQNTHVSSNNGYSKMYSPPARTYMKSPLSQEVADNFKQPNSINSNYVYSSPMASPVSNKELNIGDHTNMNENLYINSSSNDYISNGYKSLKYSSKSYIPYNKFQGRQNKDKFRPKKLDKIRQKNIYYNNTRNNKYHISPTYSKVNTTNSNSNQLYL